MDVASHHSLAELKSFGKQTHSLEIWQRLQIIILAQQCKTSHTIARELGYARSTCLEWVKHITKKI